MPNQPRCFRHLTLRGRNHTTHTPQMQLHQPGSKRDHKSTRYTRGSCWLHRPPLDAAPRTGAACPSSKHRLALQRC
jgi:hypothetical protein